MKKPGTSMTLAEVEALLDKLEARVAATAGAEGKARVLNLAGDVCIDAHQLDRGLGYYDKAITTYTATEQYDSAAKICEKIIALKPDAVRPFFTLALLAIRQERIEEACERINQYVYAAEAQKLGAVARRYLLELAEVSYDPVLLETIAERLMQLGDSESADAIWGRVHRG
jgi:tetratricopeptide (TPR) repeat protein